MPTNGPTDEQLLIDYRNGQRERFELLVRRFGQELFHFLYRLLGSAATAEDIVQETFLQVHLSADRFDASKKLRPWLFTIASNKARDCMRSKKRRPEIPLDAAANGFDDSGPSFSDLMIGRSTTPSLAMEREERSYRIRTMVEQLPSHLKEVLILGYYHGFAYKEMAEILDVPLGTIKSRVHSAVAKFGELHFAVEQKQAEK